MPSTPRGFETWVDPQPLAATLHNSELLWMSACLHGRTKVIAQTTTPATPVAADIGKVWLVGVGGTGVWTGHDNQFALWDGTQWIYMSPVDGDEARIVGSPGTNKQYNGSAWV
jgi:hypothetical protein